MQTLEQTKYANVQNMAQSSPKGGGHGNYRVARQGEAAGKDTGAPFYSESSAKKQQSGAAHVQNSCLGIS